MSGSRDDVAGSASMSWRWARPRPGQRHGSRIPQAGALGDRVAVRPALGLGQDARRTRARRRVRESGPAEAVAAPADASRSIVRCCLPSPPSTSCQPPGGTAAHGEDCTLRLTNTSRTRPRMGAGPRPDSRRAADRPRRRHLREHQTPTTEGRRRRPWGDGKIGGPHHQPRPTVRCPGSSTRCRTRPEPICRPAHDISQAVRHRRAP